MLYCIFMLSGTISSAEIVVEKSNKDLHSDDLYWDEILEIGEENCYVNYYSNGEKVLEVTYTPVYKIKDLNGKYTLNSTVEITNLLSSPIILDIAANVQRSDGLNAYMGMYHCTFINGNSKTYYSITDEQASLICNSLGSDEYAKYEGEESLNSYLNKRDENRRTMINDIYDSCEAISMMISVEKIEDSILEWETEELFIERDIDIISDWADVSIKPVSLEWIEEAKNLKTHTDYLKDESTDFEYLDFEFGLLKKWVVLYDDNDELIIADDRNLSLTSYDDFINVVTVLGNFTWKDNYKAKIVGHYYPQEIRKEYKISQ